MEANSNSDILNEMKELTNKLDELEREEATRKEREVFLLLNAVTDAVFVSDEHGIIKYANPSAFRILGYDPNYLLGTNIHSIFKTDKPIEKVDTTFHTAVSNKAGNDVSVHVYVGEYREANTHSLIYIIHEAEPHAIPQTGG
jgi:PAS domain S-box-containing protein